MDAAPARGHVMGKRNLHPEPLHRTKDYVQTWISKIEPALRRAERLTHDLQETARIMCYDISYKYELLLLQGLSLMCCLPLLCHIMQEAGNAILQNLAI